MAYDVVSRQAILAALHALPTLLLFAPLMPVYAGFFSFVRSLQEELEPGEHATLTSRPPQLGLFTCAGVWGTICTFTRLRLNAAKIAFPLLECRRHQPSRLQGRRPGSAVWFGEPAFKIAEQGIRIVLGVPLGSDAFVAAHLQQVLTHQAALMGASSLAWVTRRSRGCYCPVLLPHAPSTRYARCRTTSHGSSLPVMARPCFPASRPCCRLTRPGCLTSNRRCTQTCLRVASQAVDALGDRAFRLDPASAAVLDSQVTRPPICKFRRNTVT